MNDEDGDGDGDDGGGGHLPVEGLGPAVVPLWADRAGTSGLMKHRLSPLQGVQSPSRPPPLSADSVRSGLAVRLTLLTPFFRRLQI